VVRAAQEQAHCLEDAHWLAVVRRHTPSTMSQTVSVLERAQGAGCKLAQESQT